MSKLVADFLLQRLSAWGVRRIYGYPGDGINGIDGAFDRHKDKLEFIQARHEEMAAFMACAHAKFTGEVGDCLATPGPGTLHLRFNDLDAPQPGPRGTDYASLIESDVPIVVQRTRLGSRQAALALLSTVAFPATR